MRGFESDVDFRVFILLHGPLQKPNMEKLALIDFTLEDDSLLPCAATQKYPQRSEGILLLSPTGVSEKDYTCAEELESIDSGNVERGGGKMPVEAAVELNILCTSPGSQSKTVVEDGQQVQQYGNDPSSPSPLSCQIQEGPEELTEAETTVSRLPKLSAKNMRAARSSNLRKSLAWDKAFSTNEDGQQVQQYGNNPSGPSPLNCQIEERPDELTEAETTVSRLPKLSGKNMRAARSSNLRKSLAWDKAFSTNEGVLDFDDLPLVTKTSRKLLDLDLRRIPEIPGKVSPTRFWVFAEGIPNAIEAVQGDSKSDNLVHASTQADCHPSDLAVSLSCKTASSIVISPPIEASNLDTKAHKSDNARPVQVSQIIQSDVHRGTRLRLPRTFTGKSEKTDMLPEAVSSPPNKFPRRYKSSSLLLSPYSSSSALSKRVSSVSKRMKDTLGKVLPGAGSIGAEVESCKPCEGSCHHRLALKHLQTRNPKQKHNLYRVGEDFGSSVRTTIARSKSNRVFLSGNSVDTLTDIRRKGAEAKSSNEEVTSTTGNSTIIPGLKGSSTLQDGGLLGIIRDKVEGLSQQGFINPSFYAGTDNPVFLTKRLGPAASEIPSMERLNSASDAHSSNGFSSSLRLPSPKIGFFDTKTLPSSGEQSSSLPERVIGAALGNSYWLNPRDELQQGFSCDHAGKPYTDSFSGAGSRLARSGIPSAPHLQSLGKLEKGLTLSIPAAKLQHRHHHVMHSNSHHVVVGHHLLSQTNSNQVHSSISELKSHKLWNEGFGASGSGMLESRNWDSNQRANPVVQSEVKAQSGGMDMPSFCFSTGHEADVRSGNLDGDEGPQKLVKSSIVNKAPVEQPLLGCCQMTEVIEKSASCRFAYIGEETGPKSQILYGCEAAHSVLCTEEASSNINGVDVLTISSSFEPMVQGESHKLALDHFDSRVYQRYAKVGGVLQACPSESDGSRKSYVAGRFLGHPTEEKIRGPGEFHPELVNFVFRRSLDCNSRLRPCDHKIEDSSKCCSQKERSQMHGISCCTNEKHLPEVLAKMMTSGSRLLPTDCSKKSPEVEEQKRMSAARSATKQGILELKICSSARHVNKKRDASRKTGHTLGSTPWSGWPHLGVDIKFSHSKPVEKEHSPLITPVFEGFSDTRIVTSENTQPGILGSNARSMSPTAALDFHGCKPLAMNARLLNGKNSFMTPWREGRKAQIDGFTSEMKSGQENVRVSERLAGSMHLHKLKQRKSSSSQILDLSEAIGTTEISILFSEERLLALEASGQECLQKKSGAVQHSPPNKICPDPNPWSPVKKSAQRLGPFDCTKKFSYANL